MQFNSLTFILIFLPIFIIAFYLTKGNKYCLLFFSFLFYILSDIKYFLLLMVIIVTTYFFGKYVKRNKKIYTVYICLIILYLAFFKYKELLAKMINNPSLLNIVLPVGISYYCFEALSYISDVYREKYECDNLLNVALYISYFPTIISGPIIRFNDFKYWNDNKTIKFEDVSDGLRIFLIGLSKKVIIADQIAIIDKVCFDSSTILSVPLAWLGLFAYAIRLYYDFSGCSDMAIGIGKMMSYDMPNNFNNPYCSLSVSEFWRRWHITLGQWFKDYVYIPLGGNRASNIKWIINIMTVWLLTGLWHGSSINFLLWGLFLGVFIIFEKRILNKINLPKLVRWIYTILVTLFGWLLFRVSSMKELLHYGKNLLVGSRFEFSYFNILGIVYTWPLLIISVLLLIPSIKKFFIILRKKHMYIYDLLIVTMTFVSLICIIGGTNSASIYFGF